ncbi:hypothetical protein E8E12_006291 [Didymella heteroderae]|uniref:Uncharacterized protein n=1 Tax=Didymella heteroderae TaxID=1769908 RepID=A0A9P4WZB6_9PLEO|nr:hypothetical protein E8E12_006291 [Didymella heteroderae]
MSVISSFYDVNRACMPTCYDLRPLYYKAPESQYSALLKLPGETRNMIYTYVYGDTAVIAEAREDLMRPAIHIQLDDDDVDAGTEQGELVKFCSPHWITGLQDTCRQIRQETEDFNPLWKVLYGTSGALFRVFDQPNPFEYLRIITISLRLGDTVYEQGKFSLSEGFMCLLIRLACLRYLKEVKVHGCISFFDLEEKEAFENIWELLKMGTWIQPDFRVYCYSYRLLG